MKFPFFRRQAPPPLSRLEELKAVLIKDPNSRQFLALADEYRKENKLREALETLERGLAIHKNYVAAHVALGRVNQEMGRVDHALEAFLNALKYDRENLVALRQAADLYLAKGDKVEAIKKFKVFRALNPGDKEVNQIIQSLDTELAAARRAAAERVEPPQAAVPGAKKFIRTSTGTYSVPAGPVTSSGSSQVAPPKVLQSGPFFSAGLATGATGGLQIQKTPPLPPPAPPGQPPVMEVTYPAPSGPVAPSPLGLALEPVARPDAPFAPPPFPGTFPGQPPMGPGFQPAAPPIVRPGRPAMPAAEPPAPQAPPPPAAPEEYGSTIDIYRAMAQASPEVQKGPPPVPPVQKPAAWTATPPPAPLPGPIFSPAPFSTAPVTPSAPPMPAPVSLTTPVAPPWSAPVALPPPPSQPVDVPPRPAPVFQSTVTITHEPEALPPLSLSPREQEPIAAPVAVLPPEPLPVPEPQPAATVSAPEVVEPLFPGAVEPPPGVQVPEPFEEEPESETVLLSGRKRGEEPPPTLSREESAPPVETETPERPAGREPLAVSETLAELYRAQGYLEEAQATYEALAASATEPERARDFRSRAESLAVSQKPGPSRKEQLTMWLSRISPPKGQDEFPELDAVLSRLVAPGAAVRCALLTDREGILMAGAGDTHEPRVEKFVGEMTNFWKLMKEQSGDIGAGDPSTISLGCGSGLGLVSAAGKENLLMVMAEPSAVRGWLRFETKRAAHQLATILG